MLGRTWGLGRFHRFGVAALATSLALWALPAGAQAAFLPPVDLAPGAQDASSPQVGASSSGAATVVWRDGDNRIWGQRVNPDGSLSDAWNVSGSAELAAYSNPRLAVDNWGTATVVWQDSTDVIRGRRISASGSLGSILTLSDSQQRASGPAVAVDLFGNATVAWETVATNPTTYSVQARRVKGDGSLGPTASIYVTSDTQGVTGIFDPQVGVNPWGNAVVAWHLQTWVPEPLYARQFRASGWLGATRVVSGSFTGAGGVVVSGSGKATIAWDDSILGDGISDVVSRVMNPNGSLGSETELSPSGPPLTSSGSRVTIDGTGRATAIWGHTDLDTGSGKIQARSLDPASGTPGPLLDLWDAEGRAVWPDIAAGAGGHTVAIWTSYSHPSSNPDGVVEGRRINPDGSLGPVSNISGPNEVSRYPRVAVDRLGNATAVWIFSDGGQSRIQAAQEVLLPACSDASVAVARDTAKSIAMRCTGLAITRTSIVAMPEHGRLGVVWPTPTGGTVMYDPDPGYTGPDSFAFKAENRGGESAPATVRMTVG